MKRILTILFTLCSLVAFSQSINLNDVVRANTLSPTRTANALDAAIVYASTGTDTKVATIMSGTLYNGGATYVTGDRFTLNFASANATTTPTLNINTEGPITIVDNKGNAVAAGDVHGILTVAYDGTNFRIVGSAGGVTTMAAIGASPNANGATISGSTLNLEPASGSFGGVVTTGTQTIAGIKTLTGTLFPRTGSTSAATAPIKFTSGSLMTTAEAGGVEFLTDKYYGTITTGAARKEFTLNDAALTSGRIPYVTTNGRLIDDANFTYSPTSLLLSIADGSSGAGFLAAGSGGNSYAEMTVNDGTYASGLSIDPGDLGGNGAGAFYYDEDPVSEGIRYTADLSANFTSRSLVDKAYVDAITDRTLDTEISTVGNINTGEDILYSYTVPAGQLATNGSAIHGRISGFVANNANSKTLKLKFGSTTFMDRATTTPMVGQGLTIDFEIIRTGATSQKCNATFIGSDGIASAFYATAGETLSGTVVLVLTGEATATNDIVKETAQVKYER